MNAERLGRWLREEHAEKCCRCGEAVCEACVADALSSGAERQRSANDVMKRLKRLREEILTDAHPSHQGIGVPSLNEESGTHTSS